MTVKEQLAKNLAYYRTLAGYTQKSAAELLHTKPTTISSWERGISQPSADMLVKIAMLYKVTLSDLCGTDFKQEFSPEEKTLVFSYRKASDSDRHVVRRILDME